MDHDTMRGRESITEVAKQFPCHSLQPNILPTTNFYWVESRWPSIQRYVRALKQSILTNKWLFTALFISVSYVTRIYEAHSPKTKDWKHLGMRGIAL